MPRTPATRVPRNHQKSTSDPHHQESDGSGIAEDSNAVASDLNENEEIQGDHEDTQMDSEVIGEDVYEDNNNNNNDDDDDDHDNGSSDLKLNIVAAQIVEAAKATDESNTQLDDEGDFGMTGQLDTTGDTDQQSYEHEFTPYTMADTETATEVDLEDHRHDHHDHHPQHDSNANDNDNSNNNSNNPEQHDCAEGDGYTEDIGADGSTSILATQDNANQLLDPEHHQQIEYDYGQEGEEGLEDHNSRSQSIVAGNGTGEIIEEAMHGEGAVVDAEIATHDEREDIEQNQMSLEDIDHHHHHHNQNHQSDDRGVDGDNGDLNNDNEYNAQDPRDEMDVQDQCVEHDSSSHDQQQDIMYNEQQEHHSAHMYEQGNDEEASIDYTIISTAAANSSLVALSQAISSSVNSLATGLVNNDNQRSQQSHQHDGNLDHSKDVVTDQQQHDPRYSLSAELNNHTAAVSQNLSHSVTPQPHAHSPSSMGSMVAVTTPSATPLVYKTGIRSIDTTTPRKVTPAKRGHSSAHGGHSSGNSRLKSKVWHWYDILEDGYRQCRYCTQKYGPLTATTILARHYHNRHDSNTPSHRTTHSKSHAMNTHAHHQHLALTTHVAQQSGAGGVSSVSYNQAAVAAVAAAAAAAAVNGGATPTSDSQSTGHLFHTPANGTAAYNQAALAVSNGTATDELLRSVSEAVRHGPYEDGQILMQVEGFSTMITSPLARVNLTPARRALAAVGQFCGNSDVQKNLQTCIQLIGSAARRGAKMLFLPEASDYIPENRNQSAQQAQSLDGPFIKELQQAAKTHGIWVSVGIHEQVATGNNSGTVGVLPYNTNAVINDEGLLISIYRKLHMFDVNVKDGPRLLESSTTMRGGQITDPVDTPVGKLGLAVCYDMRFPELAQRLRQRGAQLLCYPSAFTEQTGASHWEVLLRARAIETQCYVMAAAHVGKHNTKRSSYGDALIVDPWGTVVARCSKNTKEPSVALAEINLDYLDKTRKEMPVFNHKRADIFREYAS